MTLPGFPPIPDEILELEGKLESLENAIEQLKADTHPALREHQAALQQLDSQLARHQEELEANTPAELSQEVRSTLQSMIDEDPLCDALSLADAAKQAPIKVVFPYIERLRNSVESRHSVDDARKQYSAARQTETTRLDSEILECRSRLDKAKAADLDLLMRTFFKQFTHGKNFPFEAWAKFEDEVLRQRRYSGDSREWLVKATELHTVLQVAPLSAPKAEQPNVKQHPVAVNTNNDSQSTQTKQSLDEANLNKASGSSRSMKNRIGTKEAIAGMGFIILLSIGLGSYWIDFGFWKDSTKPGQEAIRKPRGRSGYGGAGSTTGRGIDVPAIQGTRETPHH